jgi:hypothetical protein
VVAQAVEVQVAVETVVLVLQGLQTLVVVAERTITLEEAVW